ncbi:MAG TPA: protein phosphatase 2C domain-containing protein [Thermomicrobiales bacterium]|jgi:protein phosphatase
MTTGRDPDNEPASDEMAAAASDTDAVAAVEPLPAPPISEAVLPGEGATTAAPQGNPPEVIAPPPEPASGDEMAPESAPEAPLTPPAVEIAAADPLTTMLPSVAPESGTADPPTPATPPAEPAIVADIATIAGPHGSPGDTTYLDEVVLPSAILSPPALPEGTVLGPDDGIQIERLLDTRGRLNRYSALLRQRDDTPVPIELREAPADHADLQREAEVLAEVRYAMLPQFITTFERDSRRYLALELPRAQGTLADALGGGLTAERAVAVVLQLTQALRKLHAAGWALLGLQPAHVMLGAPLCITRLGTAARIGQDSAGALSVAGYSAPEVAHRASVTGKEDVYTLGALLYRVLVGAPVPEGGAELAALGALVRLPGAPQLLDAALAPTEERVDLDTFYQHLLAFKERCSRRLLGLEIAHGTTIGLNRTRVVNEDAYACVTWSVAHHDRTAARALLCAVDGMGGMEAGEVASRAAVRAVLDGVSSRTSLDAAPPDPVTLVQAAARAVHEAAQGRTVGATITCAIVDDGVVTLAHVGDTRAYLLRDGTLTQLTHDHSLVAAMVASGVLTSEEARGHPDSNKVLRSLGGQRELGDGYIDTLATTQPERELRLREGDHLLLCSDGVWGVVDDDTLRDIILDAPGLASAVPEVLRRVLDGGAPDNATLIVARCIHVPTA